MIHNLWVYRPENKDYTVHRLLLGTHTTDEQNHLQIATVHLPTEQAEIDARKYDDERGEAGGYGGVDCRVSIVHRINHDGEVNRYCSYIFVRPNGTA